MLCAISYEKLMRQSKDPRMLRYEMARVAREKGIKATARIFGTTVKTVRKWARRAKPGSLQGCQELSRAPHHRPKRISDKQRRQAIALKRRFPSFGAARLKREYKLALSDKALRRIWRAEGLLRTKRRKHKTKQDLRAVKAAWRLFEQVDLDTKDLIDIPELWPQLRRLGLPRVQYTAREVVSGLQFLGFAQERSLSSATLFSERLLAHLVGCGVDLASGCRWQTDNGSEFIGSWQARHESSFTLRAQSFPGVAHCTIPPAAHTWQADVETAHRLIEDEFYEVETFLSRVDFLARAAAYNLWFNVARTNSYKTNRTPWQIVHDRDPHVDPKVATLPPVFLDELFNQRLTTRQGGDDAVPYP